LQDSLFSETDMSMNFIRMSVYFSRNFLRSSVRICVGQISGSLQSLMLFFFMQSGSTALFLASQCGHFDVVNLLLCHGAMIDLQNEVRGPLITHFGVSNLHRCLWLLCEFLYGLSAESQLFPFKQL